MNYLSPFNLIFGSIYIVKFKGLYGQKGFRYLTELSNFTKQDPYNENEPALLTKDYLSHIINNPLKGKKPIVPRRGRNGNLGNLDYFGIAILNKNPLQTSSLKWNEQEQNLRKQNKINEYMNEVNKFFVTAEYLFTNANNFFLNPNELANEKGKFNIFNNNFFQVNDNELNFIEQVIKNEREFHSYNDEEITEQVISSFFKFSPLALKYLAIASLKEINTEVDKYIDENWANILEENMFNTAIICSEVSKQKLPKIKDELTRMFTQLKDILEPSKTTSKNDKIMNKQFKCIWKLDSEKIEITFNSREPYEIFTQLKSRQNKEEQPIWIKYIDANCVVISSFPDDKDDYGTLTPKIDDFGNQGGLEKADDADNENTFKCDLKRLETFLHQRGEDTANFTITIKLDSDFDVEDIVNIFAIVKKVQEVGEGAIWLDKTTDDDGYLMLSLETYPIVVERLYSLYQAHNLSDLLGFKVVNLESKLLTPVATASVAGVKDKISQPTIVDNVTNQVEKAISNVSNVIKAINLSQWLQNDFSQATNLGWQETKNLLNISTENLALNTMNDSIAEQAKLIDLGVQLGNKKVVLKVAVLPEEDNKVGISIKVYPYQEDFLPPNLKLVMLNPKGKVIQENESRNLDNSISLKYFTPKQGKKFTIQLSLGEANVILHSQDFMS